jgi:hypothetical protein
MLRKLIVLVFTGGGVWAALRGVEEIAIATGAGTELNLWSGEGLLLAVPVIMIGALLGAVFGGMLLPLRK